MSTATAEPDQVIEALVQQPDPSVLFIAKRDELRLTKIARRPMLNPVTGERLGMTAGATVSFAPSGEFRCPLEGDVTIMDPGGAGEATMPAKELLDWLERHPRCGDPNEGFYRVDPKAPPLGQQEQQRLVEAATAWDVDTLRAIVSQERAGWNRTELIEVALGAISKIEEAEGRIRADEREVREAEEQAAASQAQQLAEAQARAEAAEKRAAAAEAKAKK